MYAMSNARFSTCLLMLGVASVWGCKNAASVGRSSQSPAASSAPGTGSPAAFGTDSPFASSRPAGNSPLLDALRSTAPKVRVDALRQVPKSYSSSGRAVLAEVVELLGDEALYEKVTRVRGYGTKEGGDYSSGGMTTVREPIGELAAAMLVRIGAPAVEGLASALTRRERKVRQRAACALAQLGPAGCVQGLVDMVSDESQEARTCVVHALGNGCGAWALAPLYELIGNDPDVLLRRRAIYSLARMRDVPSEEDNRGIFLRALLHDPQPAVVASAVQALGQLRVEAATLDIIEILGKGEAWQRSLAAKALGLLQDRRAIPALRRATRDSDKNVRTDAKNALQEIQSGKQAASPPEFDLLPDI